MTRPTTPRAASSGRVVKGKYMTQQEKRIKIAEKCGWAAKEDGDGFWRAVNPQGQFELDRWISESNVWNAGIPDYFSSLDTCHEMEKRVLLSWADYKIKLIRVCRLTNDDECHATATQRAEAFGITMGLWKEGE